MQSVRIKSVMTTDNYSGVAFAPTSDSAPETSAILTENIAIASTLALLIVFTIFGNSLVCAAFYLSRDLRSVTNYFVVSLAVADLLVGFVCTPFWFVFLIKKWPSQDDPFYTLWICLDIVSGTSSIMNLVAISVDRFCAITSPFNYHLKLTKRRARLCIVVLWMYSIAVASLRILRRGPWYAYFVASASFFVPLPVLVFSYARIFMEAHRQAKKIRLACYSHGYELPKMEKENSEATETSAFVDAMHNATACSSSVGGRKGRPHLTSQSSFRQMRRHLHSDLKAAKTLAIVMGAFIACWTPYIVSLLVSVACGFCIPYKKALEIAKAVKWLHYSNSAVNPIIYTLLNRNFRAAFKKILCRFVLRRRFSYVNRLLSHSTPRSSIKSAGNNMIDADKTHFKSEVEVLVCTEIVSVL